MWFKFYNPGTWENVSILKNISFIKLRKLTPNASSRCCIARSNSCIKWYLKYSASPWVHICNLNVSTDIFIKYMYQLVRPSELEQIWWLRLGCISPKFFIRCVWNTLPWNKIFLKWKNYTFKEYQIIVFTCKISTGTCNYLYFTIIFLFPEVFNNGLYHKNLMK